MVDVAAALALAPSAAQSFPHSTGLGTLEKARGSSHVSINGTDLTGEIDVQDAPWRPAVWAPLATAGTAWTDGTWNGNVWTGSDWAIGSTDWSGHTWKDSSWTGHTWKGDSWTSQTWAGASWTGHTWKST